MVISEEELAWKEYQRLEEEFLSTCDYVDLVHQHLGVYSYKLMNLIVATGIEFDTVSNRLLRKWLAQNRISDQNLLSELSGCREFKITHYRKAFEHVFSASTRLIHVDAIDKDLQPFDPPPESGQGLKWWKAFTSLKHDRIANLLQSATVGNALEALAALLLVNLFFRRQGEKVEILGQSVSHIFTVPFLKPAGTMGAVAKMTYRFQN